MPDQLRNLTFNIGYNIQDRPIVQADRKVEDYKKTVVDTDKDTRKLATTTDRAAARVASFGRTGRNEMSSLGSAIKRIGFGIGAYFTFGAAKRALGDVLSLAGDLQEETSKFNTVFGGVGRTADQLADEASAWAVDYAERVGRSRLETMKFLSESQNLFVGFGATRAEAFEFSKQIQELGVDLASFNNVADSRALELLQSGLLGNHQAVKSLGIAMTETTLQAKALQMGYKENFAALDPLIKSQIRLQVAIDQSQDAIGDAERTSGSYTNQLKRLQGSMMDLKAEAGQALIPAMTDLIIVVNENKDSIVALVEGGVNIAKVGIKALAATIDFLSGKGRILIPILAGITTGLVALKVATVVATGISLFTGATTAATAATGAFGIALLPISAPILGIAAAIGAVTAAVVALVAYWDEVKAFFEGFASIEVPEAVVERRTRSTGARPVHQRSGGGSRARGFATGTSSAPRGMAMVGENGPEPVFFNGGESVMTNARMRQSMGGSSDTLDINVNISGETTDSAGASIGTTIKDALDNYFSEMATKRGYRLNGAS